MSSGKICVTFILMELNRDCSHPQATLVKSGLHQNNEDKGFNAIQLPNSLSSNEHHENYHAEDWSYLKMSYT